MTGKSGYSLLNCRPGINSFTVWKIIILLSWPAFLQSNISYCQPEPEFEEISVFFNVPLMGGIDMPAIIRRQEIYLPITGVFDFLKIRNIPTMGFDSITGFLINLQAPFLIDRVNSNIYFQGKVYNLKTDDLIRTESYLFLKLKYFGNIFGLECTFDFRSLSVTLNTKIELPVIREMRHELLRKNMTRLSGNLNADTTIRRAYPFFHFGMADWALMATQQINGPVNFMFNLALGSIFAGGEANILINYSNNEPFTEKQQYYLWHFVNNENRFFRQIYAGKISTQSISTLNAPVVGVQVTNTPTTYRRSFCSYTLSDYTEPGWIVELYVNYLLVDYLRADASGFFTFEVPLVYGTSLVMLRFYGPWGEERSRQQYINIPYNFLPPKKMEYMVSTGIVEDDFNSRFARANVNYGLSRRISIGGGVEYLSSLSSGNYMPFINFSMRLASSLLISGDYTYGVRFRGILSYRLPSNLQFELNYTNYKKDQMAINTNFLEERKATISMPVHGKKISAFFRLSVNQIILPKTQRTTAELLISGSAFGVNTNLTTYAMFSDAVSPYIYSNLSLGFRFWKGFIFIPQVQYEYTQNSFVSMKFELEKRIFKHGVLNVSYEQNFSYNIRNIMVGFRYDFSFAQTGISAMSANNTINMTQSARGSLMFDEKTKYVGANNRTSVGRGGIVIAPYLDLNYNGRREKNEPRAFGLNLLSNNGLIEQKKQDTTIRILDLEPYTNYYIELDRNSFDNIAWKIQKPIISVTIEPNQFKLIEVPITIAGEASGFVYLDGINDQKGQGRIIVCFYNSNSTLVARTLTEEDGYFSYLGLPPGSYVAQVDTAQLHKLNLVVTPDSIDFNISQSLEGDIADGIKFILRSRFSN